MRKLILSAFMLMGLAFNANAQDISKHAIGLRLGSNDGFGGEISYQHGLSGNNRLEFDLGWRDNNHFDAIKLAGLYQWVWNIEGGFNWYAGVGGGFGNWSYHYDHPKNSNDWKEDHNEFAIFVAGDIGIEYNFDFPLQLSLDFRPEIYINDGLDDHFGPDVALGIRYRW
ncbi:hypothetical protein ACFS5J_01135 [Flavobacterium chuncheonense]|uniref:Secreted protein n=1 Tax=Flavobacterium chuncheonense TaxID=2026653 RepID=A0ABW5YI11_9FLAO